MPNINLLPEELKEKEKENFFVQGDKKKVSFWRRLFSGDKSYNSKTLKQGALHIPKLADDKKKPARPAENIDSVSLRNKEEEKLKLEESKKRKREIKNERKMKKKSRTETGILSRIFKPKRVLSEIKVERDANISASNLLEKPNQESSRKETRGKEEKQEFLDVNLIPDEISKQPELEFQKRFYLSISIVFSTLAIVIFAYLGILWYQLSISKHISDVEERMAVLNREISNFENNKDQILSLRDYMEALEGVLKGHIYWTNFFELLEKYTIEEIYYTSFSMSGHDRLVISAVGKDYQSAAKQLVAFQKANNFIKNVRIDAVSATILDDKGNYQINFNINLEFLPNVFLKYN